MGANNTIPAGSSVVVGNGATLDMNGSYNFSDTIAALSGAGILENFNSYIQPQTLTVSGNASPLNSQNFNGYSCIAAGMFSSSSGSGSTLVKGGTHSMAFRGANASFGGKITLTGGTLSVGALAQRAADHLGARGSRRRPLPVGRQQPDPG